MTELSDDARVILLLTVPLSHGEKNFPKPLTPAEWKRFTAWLAREKRRPADLLDAKRRAQLLEKWNWKNSTENAQMQFDWQKPRNEKPKKDEVDAQRINRLLARESDLKFALQEWEKAGLWVLTHADPDYPMRLKERLSSLSVSPVLFGCGNRVLLAEDGRKRLAVVGSRNTPEDDLEFARKLAQVAARNDCIVISGGARGVDEEAMDAALEAGGTVLAVLPGELKRACTSAKYGPFLRKGRLALVSPFHPVRNFLPFVQRAMPRNHFIYCLADVTVVIHSEAGKGGTWHGAVNNLNKGWVPLWIRRNGASGNAELIRMGGKPLSDTFDEDLASLFEGVDPIPACQKG